LLAPDADDVEKKHRVAVGRALRKMELPPLWRVGYAWVPGAELYLQNTRSFESTLRADWIRGGQRGSFEERRQNFSARNRSMMHRDSIKHRLWRRSKSRSSDCNPGQPRLALRMTTIAALEAEKAKLKAAAAT
jgi:hypothetical protein